MGQEREKPHSWLLWGGVGRSLHVELEGSRAPVGVVEALADSPLSIAGLADNLELNDEHTGCAAFVAHADDVRIELDTPLVADGRMLDVDREVDGQLSCFEGVLEGIDHRVRRGSVGDDCAE